MNERIQELAKQADVEWLLEHHLKLEKFAQLIGKECLMLADNIRDECDVDDEPQQALGAAWVALAITRHFGLEV